MTQPITGLAHLCHHDQHYEWCTDYESRVQCLKNSKPYHEVPIRLKYFQIIPVEMMSSEFRTVLAKVYTMQAESNTMWAKVYTMRAKANTMWAKADTMWTESDTMWAKADTMRAKADTMRDEADAMWTESNTMRAKANTMWDEAILTFSSELDVIHTKLFPDCPWDGKTMFPEKRLIKEK